MLREDYRTAVPAADHCLRHPAFTESAEVLRLKGRALAELGKLPEAESIFEKAAVICRREAEKKPASLLPALGQCLCDRAEIFIRSKQIQKAEEILQQAERNLQQESCVDAGFGFYLANLRVLEEKCRVRMGKEQCGEALDDAGRFQHYLTEAYCYFPEPEKVRTNAEAYTLYGDLYLELETDYQAKEKYSVAKSWLRDLRSFLPDAYPVFFADVCNNLGIAFSRNSRSMNEAKQEYQDAAELLESITDKAPSAVELLGDCYYNLGLLYQD